MTNEVDRLNDLMSELPSELQEEVLDFAQYLLDTKVHGFQTGRKPRFYICPVCFTASETRRECHGQLMVPCNADKPEDCKPLMDEDGRLRSPAPRWFVATVAEKK